MFDIFSLFSRLSTLSLRAVFSFSDQYCPARRTLAASQVQRRSAEQIFACFNACQHNALQQAYARRQQNAMHLHGRILRAYRLAFIAQQFYDLAELASLIIWGYSWTAAVPVTIMLILPIISDAAAIVTAGIAYYRRQSMLSLLSIIFSIAALALYYILRTMMQFSLGWLDPII